MQDLSKLNDQEFEELRASVMSEQVKRNRMREIPEEIHALKGQFESYGGTTEQLIDKLNEPTPEPEVKTDAEFSTPDTAKDTSEPL